MLQKEIAYIINQLYLIREDYIDYGMKERVDVLDLVINLVSAIYTDGGKYGK